MRFTRTEHHSLDENGQHKSLNLMSIRPQNFTSQTIYREKRRNLSTHFCQFVFEVTDSLFPFPIFAPNSEEASLIICLCKNSAKYSDYILYTEVLSWLMISQNWRTHTLSKCTCILSTLISGMTFKSTDKLYRKDDFRLFVIASFFFHLLNLQRLS